MDVAFGVANESGGRPRISLCRKLEIFGALSKEIEQLKKAGADRPVGQAQANIAKRFDCSVSTVRRIFDQDRKSQKA
jgi:DNA invertase Pin-like site-specific DNA recombinase